MLNKWMAGALVALISISAGIEVAEAKRLGGSRSLGMQRQVAPTPPKAPTATPQQAAPTNQAVKPNAAPGAQPAAAQSGWRKWMGPLAGLAAGIGLASLLSHFGMGGEFAGLLLAILAVVVVIALLRRFMGNRQASSAYNRPAYAGNAQPQFETPVARQAQFEPGGGVAEPSAATAEADKSSRFPAGFDADAFARQAKVNFIRLQAANDACNMADIREFSTPEMFAEIKLAIDERGCKVQKTDVMQLEAEVLEVAEENARYVVSVRYTGLLREEADSAPQAFDEVWHLSKPVDGNTGWQLAGIQQLG